jgi:hypothetical protein
MYKLLQSYLFFKIFQVRLLVQCYLWHVLEEISNFKAAQLHGNILIQSRVVCTQIVIPHLTKYTANLVKVAKYYSFTLLINSMLWEDSHTLNCVFSLSSCRKATSRLSSVQLHFCVTYLCFVSESFSTIHIWNTDGYLIIVIVKCNSILVIQVSEILRQVAHPQLVPPFRVWVLALILLLHLLT